MQYNGLMEKVSEGQGKKWNPEDGGPGLREGERSLSQKLRDKNG